MKERPILFSAPMVRAILDGSKTQTRRIVKPNIVNAIEFMGESDHDDDINATAYEFVGLKYHEWADDDNVIHPHEWLIYCTEYPEEGVIPIGQVYGAIGDQLWVRETWLQPGLEPVIYKADAWAERLVDDCKKNPSAPQLKWKPSIHMPRAASRIQLEITGVRVERLQDISEEDAKAEGIEPELDGWIDYSNPSAQMCLNPIDSFRTLWEAINGPGGWAANPWVWVIEFKRLL